MRRSILFIVSLVCTTLHAQPELVSSLFQPIGTSTTYDVVENYEAIDTTQQGPDAIWDFGELITSGPQSTFVYIDPSTTPEGASFPSANYAIANSTMSYVDYYIKTDTYLDRIGIWLQDIGTYIASDHQRQLVFPMTLGTVNYDTFNMVTSSGSYSIAGIGTGTLILPSGTYTNVIMVRSINSTQPSPAYSWFSTENGTRLLHFTLGDGLSIPNIAWIFSDPSSAVPEHGMLNKLTAVDPVMDVLEIIYSSDMIGTLDLTITNTLGQRIQNDQVEVGNGPQRSQVFVGDLARGIYLLSLRYRNADLPASTIRFVKR